MKKLILMLLIGTLFTLTSFYTNDQNKAEAGIFRRGPVYIFSWRRPNRPNPSPQPPQPPPPVDLTLLPPTPQEQELDALIEQTKEMINKAEEEAKEAEVVEVIEETEEEEEEEGEYTKGIIALFSALGLGGAGLAIKSSLKDKQG